MWEAITPASHGGKSIRRIFIFALVTIVMSFLCLFTFSQPTSAVADRFQANSQTTEAQDAVIKERDAAAAAEAEAEPKTECAVDGIGWIVCPITKALAGGMDFIYDMLSGFLVVQPAESDDDDALYRAWTYMRSFANIAFVIAFLIIIYSQITSMGVSNYGIKRLLPRLIIAAILVNVSYYICAVAIDIFNILGYSFQDLFMMMREGLIGSDVSYTDIPTWKSVTAVVLSGGTLVGLSIAASAYSVAGLALLLVPALMTCLLAVLVALVVMAARQAVITILVILAPLAFVAYLLPNTEKLFEKWKSAFITLLVLFPAFSVVFGGSQLASIAIIKNANSIAVVILGLLVQVAPLMITPLLIKFGGGILGKISGMVNNPAKGAFDRVSNMAREKAEINKLDRLSKNPHKANVPRRLQQGIDFNRRNRELRRKTAESAAESNFMSKRYGTAGADSKMIQDEIRAKTMADQASDVKGRVDSAYENFKAGVATDPLTGEKLHAGHPLSELARQSEAATKNIAISGMAMQSAKRIQVDKLSKSLKADESLRKTAGGIDYENGGQRSLASAINSSSKLHQEIIANANTVIDNANLNSDSLLLLAQGESAGGIDASNDIREAAIAKIAGSNNARSIIALSKTMDFTPDGNPDFRTAFTDNIVKSGLRPAFISYKIIDEMSQGIPGGFGDNGVKQQIFSMVNEKKLSTDILISQAIDSIKETSSVVQNNLGEFSDDGLLRFRELIKKAYDTPEYAAKIGDKDEYFKIIQDKISERLGPEL